MLNVAHHDWSSPLRRPAMSNDEDARPGVSLTSRYLTRHGVPVIPVSGEMHYSRIPRARWRERLRQLRSGGVTVVSSYVFWLHHVEHRGEPRFDGNLDLAAFFDLAVAEGFDVILRIGPWCHGESRNGGFPDWVQQAPVRHRTDDPGYLSLVREWFGQIAQHLDGRQGLGIQLENELYDQPGHLVTLKRLAREAGMSAPLWTATAWGSADLPAEEVLPLYGGYGDGFWVDADAPWDPTFRDHYFFSHVWDDPGIGADLRRLQLQGMRADRSHPRTPSELFPPATCELGGGMATAYHRRPRPAALDIAAIAHCKIGNGSAWQGYYMYAGGTNPPGEQGTQESHATGYPNDMPRLGYDFHAPVGEAGVPAGSHAALRSQHAFLAAFGSSLAEMPSSLPFVRPSGVEDAQTLRWALRSDGNSGFLFIAWHQPHVPLPVYRGARFSVRLDSSTVELPAAPVDIPPGTLARWPLRLSLGGVRLDWATASALTVLPGEVPTLVLVAEAGIEASYSVGGCVATVEPGLTPVRLRPGGGELDLLVLPAAVAAEIWVCPDGPERRLLLSPDELAWGPSGRIESSGPRVQVYDPAVRGFRQLTLEAAPPADRVHKSDLSVIGVRPAGTAVPVAYGKFDGRQSAPSPAAFDELAAVYQVPLPSWAADGSVDAFLHLRWAGDVGQLRVDGRPVTDRFWDGSEWIVNLRDAGVRPGVTLTLHLLPLAAGSTIALPPDARDRLATADGQLLAIDSVRLRGRAVWREPHPVRRSARRMPDGREIVYFDDTPPFRDREAVDLRSLPPAAAAPEMRRDPLTGEWVTIAAHRNDRTFLPPPDQDPLAPTAPGGFPTEIAEPAYDVVVFENRFPSFSPRAGGSPDLVDGDPLWPVRPAAGRTEVVVFSSAPQGSFGSLTPHRARTVIEAWADRTAVLNASPDVEYVFPFENRGREIGVTLPHPHGQIYAFPFVPPKAARMIEMASAHPGGNLFGDILDAERRAGTRIVATSAHWTAYVPAAARWPLEVHLAPHRDVPDLPALTSAERDDLALIYLDLLGRLDRYFPGVEMPYISGVFQAPAHASRDLFRLHLQVFSILRTPAKLKHLAGVESAMAAWINDTRPETVAARLRSLA
ncbi:galactose-1-phosphate uridylyltransferase [Actinoplanes sp. KI2]|uniref:galactose-1-phosphate uridylyltransferase n=1 Tax=Actinoplanes sp. KI2 TaxID=2983315 RepID=UPI0029500315|nr:galactose-1-phosphate uridylyltransferase [Actinoplanes sp. KI2]